MLIAVIGPDDARRRVVTKALSNSEDRTVQEFAAYPAKLSDLPRMMEQNYDVVMVDLDSNQEYALEIVEFLAAIANTTVMVYSTRNDPSLLEAAIKVGARDLLPIPADAVGAASRSSAAGTNGAGPARTAGEQQFREETRPAARQDAAEASPAKKPDTGEIGSYKGGAFYPKTDPQSMVRRTEPAQSASEFKQWDASPVRAAQPAGVKAPEANSRPAPAPSAPRPGITAVPPAPRAATAAAPAARSIAPAPLARGESRQSAVDSAPAAPARTHGGIETDADVLELFRNKAQADELPKPEVDWKKWGLIAAGAAALLVVVLILFMRPSGKGSAAAPATQPVASQPESSVAVPSVNTAGANPSTTKPSASLPVAPAASSTVTPEATTHRVGSEMMDAQLSAPSRISKDVKRTSAEDTPVTLAPVAIDEGSGVPGQVFGGASKVKVVAPVSAISAGVAEGMLIHKTEPVYPRFAKDNHISGTVVLKAKIGKNGLLQDLRVVSGPKLLGSAALDAAKSWKYRPYMLNNQPVDVDTSISVVFSLGRE
jgi:protein TonB